MENYSLSKDYFVEDNQLKKHIFFISKDLLKNKIEQIIVGENIYYDCSFISVDRFHKTINEERYDEYQYSYKYFIKNNSNKTLNTIKQVRVKSYIYLTFCRKNLEHNNQIIKYKDCTINIQQNASCIRASNRDNDHHFCDTIFYFILENEKGFTNIEEIAEIINFLKLFFLMFFCEDITITEIELNNQQCYLYGENFFDYLTEDLNEYIKLLYSDSMHCKKIWQFYNLHELLFNYFELLSNKHYFKIVKQLIETVLLENDFLDNKIPNLIKLIEKVANPIINRNVYLKEKLFLFKEQILSDYIYEEIIVKNIITVKDIVDAVNIRNYETHSTEDIIIDKENLKDLYIKMLGLLFTFFYKQLNINKESIQDYWGSLAKRINYINSNHSDYVYKKQKFLVNHNIKINEDHWGNLAIGILTNKIHKNLNYLFTQTKLGEEKVVVYIEDYSFESNFDLTKIKDFGKMIRFSNGKEELDTKIDSICEYIYKMSVKNDFFILNKEIGEYYFFSCETLSKIKDFKVFENDRFKKINNAFQERFCLLK